MACGAEQGLLGIDEALALIQSTVKPLATIQVATQNSLSKYLAQDVYATVDLPPFRQSAVDGYALCSDTEILTGHTFTLVNEVRAGQPQNTILQVGQAQRIFTGAAVPQGCVTVARQEIVSKISNDLIQIQANVKSNADTREQGEEIGRGQCMAQAGQLLHVGAIAALCMAGIPQLSVYKRPKVAVVITGDEVAQQTTVFDDDHRHITNGCSLQNGIIHDDTLPNGIIHDANGPMLMAWLQQQGYDAELHHVVDDAQALQQCFATLKSRVDVILTTGGVSVGDYDLVRPCAFAKGFEQIFWKVKQKPGKPLFFAKTNTPDSSESHCCYLLGLPGNPAAVYVGIVVYVQTLLQALQGQTQGLPWFNAILNTKLKPDARERFLRMSARIEAGQIYLERLDHQQSHMLSNLLTATCLVRVPEQQELAVGTLLPTLWL